MCRIDPNAGYIVGVTVVAVALFVGVILVSLALH